MNKNVRVINKKVSRHENALKEKLPKSNARACHTREHLEKRVSSPWDVPKARLTVAVVRLASGRNIFYINDRPIAAEGMGNRGRETNNTGGLVRSVVNILFVRKCKSQKASCLRNDDIATPGKGIPPVPSRQGRESVAAILNSIYNTTAYCREL